MTDNAPLDALALEQCSDALICADRQGRITRWNAAAERLFGFSKAQALGQSLDLIIPERLRAAHWAGFEAAMQSGQLKLAGRPTRTRSLCQSGDRLYVQMSFALIKDAGGQCMGSVAMARACD